MKRIIVIAGIACLSAAGTMAQSSAPGMEQLLEYLRQSEDSQVQLDVLKGMSEAVKGHRDVPMPRNWNAVEEKLSRSNNPQVRLLTQTLGLTFGSKEAVAQLRKVVLDKKADVAARRAALDSLLTTRDPELPALLRSLLDDEPLRGQAIRGMARFEDPETAKAILGHYSKLTDVEKKDALNTLASRATYARALLEAVSSHAVDRKDLTAELVRQLRNLKSADLDDQIQKVWGVFRDASADKLQEIEKYKKIYRAGGSQPGDASRGRAVFVKTCQQCHTLFDVGGQVGPDITGSNRADLQYILETIVDPNAVIPSDYQTSTVTTKDDRVITGIVKKQDANSLTIVTSNETLTLPRQDLESVLQSSISMMPEGLLAALSDQEVRDLIYYLSRPGQVPLPKE